MQGTHCALSYARAPRQSLQAAPSVRPMEVRKQGSGRRTTPTAPQPYPDSNLGCVTRGTTRSSVPAWPLGLSDLPVRLPVRRKG